MQRDARFPVRAKGFGRNRSPGAAGARRLPWLRLVRVGLAVGILIGAAAQSEGHSFYHENVLGTSLQIHVDSPSLSVDRKAEAAVLREIDRLSAILSTYSEASEVSAFLAGPKTAREVSRELSEVLQACDHWRAVSGGAFNPAAEVSARLWRQSAAKNRVPSEGELSEAVRRMQDAPWTIDTAGQTVARRNNLPVSLNALAKGYILDQATRVALAGTPGVRGLLLDIGGDIRVSGEAAETIGIADPWSPYDNAEPLCSVRLQNGAIATSGNYERGFEINGKHYSHIIDPRSGRPVDHVVSASVVAPQAVEADALATILNVLKPAEGVALVNGLENTECLIITRQGETFQSAGWARLSAAADALTSQEENVASEAAEPLARLVRFAEAPEAAGAAEAADAAEPAEAEEEPKPPREVPDGWLWGEEFELVVDFELKRGGWYRYARPYVAVWIEDPQGRPLRTLALWFNDYRWLPDLRRWYYLHRRDRQLIRAVSRPTRRPGRYRIVWDGRANDAKYVPVGQYYVLIEVVREHGSYQLIRQPVELRAEPFTVQAKGNYEVPRAAVEYRVKKSLQQQAAQGS